MAFGDFTVTRASTKNVLGDAGLYVSVANNVPAFEFNTDGTYRGLLVEPGATNLALNSRNLTTASWSATNVTTAQTATGADGGANSATTLTASAGNGTVLQAITSASASRVFSAVVRRRTGTGVVEITQDNGSTWTAITLTTSFQRFTTPNQTLTNPTVGFRIVTSGDAIDVDFTQAETGSVATSPIVTTAGTASRVADSVVLSSASSLIGQSEGTMYAEVVFRGGLVALPLPSGNRQIFSISDNTTANRVAIFIPDTTIDPTGTIRGFIQAATGGTVLNAGTATAGIMSAKIALAYKSGDYALYVNGVLTASGSSAFSFGASLTKVVIGARQDVAFQFNDHIRSVALFPTRLANATLETLTT